MAVKRTHCADVGSAKQQCRRVNCDRHSSGTVSGLLIDRQFTSRWDGFVEYVGDFPERGGPRHLAHFGTSWKLTPRQQLDFHVGLGLSAAAVDHFIGVGYSFRLPALRR